jgi:hypothetical protein
MPGRLRALGGSRDDDFNHYVFSQATSVGRINPADPQSIERETKAAMTAMLGVAPRDEIEGMIAGQLWGLHCATMDCFGRAALSNQTPEARAYYLSAGTKLTRGFGAMVDTLNRHRGKGQQAIRVEHVTVNGGQAIVGSNVNPQGGGSSISEGQAHAQIAHAPVAALPCQDPQREAVPVAEGEGPETLPDARRG